MALQVSEVRTQFEYLKQDISDVDAPVFLQWCNMIHRYAYRALKATEPQRFITSQSYTVSTTPSTQALPSDFRDMREEGTGFYYTDDDSELTPIRLPQTGRGSEQLGYYLEGSNVIFTGIEDTVGKTFVLRYIPNLTALSSTSSYFTLDTTNTGVEIIPDEYLDFVLQALDVRYSQWDEDTPSEGNADQRFTRVLDEMLGYYGRAPRVFSLPTDYFAY